MTTQVAISLRVHRYKLTVRDRHAAQVKEEIIWSTAAIDEVVDHMKDEGLLREGGATRRASNKGR